MSTEHTKLFINSQGELIEQLSENYTCKVIGLFETAEHVQYKLDWSTLKTN
jgi:hypothetical protein